MSLAGRFRVLKVQELRRLEMERRRESQEIFQATKSVRGTPR
jgi:hypothetical protein